jgi:hypothetical protein
MYHSCTEGQLGIATTKKLQYETCKFLFDIIVRRGLKNVRLGAQVQQRKPFFRHKHVLKRLSMLKGMRIGPLMIGNM